MIDGAGITPAGYGKVIVSEKLTGLTAEPASKVIISEKLSGLKAQPDSGRVLVSEKLAGPVSPPSPIEALTVSRGFDWGDAGVGASAAFGAMLLALGAAVATRKTRTSKFAL